MSHQINDGGNMVFAEDFLEKKEAEAQAQAAAEQSQIEHNRQKELLDAQARTAEAQALTAQATAQAQPPALEGDQAPPVLSENTPPPPATSSIAKDIFEVVAGVAFLAALAFGAYLIYERVQDSGSNSSNGTTSESAPKQITGYETEIKFIKDGGLENINDYTSKGWEIKSQRRAWAPGILEEREWGTEYTLSKPIYE